MVVVQHLIAPATLPSPSGCLSLMSYNILLPNSVDGWWNYKMYLPPLGPDKMHVSSWEYRKQLLKKRIETADPDIVCLQEVAPASFADDFSFMKELGYDYEMFRKGRFRPATFWKSEKCKLVSGPVHKDRTLLTAFSIPNCEKTWYVLNCHLQAGKEGKRRLRQINEGVRAVMTLARKNKDKDPESSTPLIVCGDFNGGKECAAVRYIEDGFLDETFIEDGEQVTSSKKECPLKIPFVDIPATIDGRDPPNTLVVPELISILTRGDGYENPELSADVVDRLTRIYEKYATFAQNGNKVMNIDDVKQWLTVINKQVGRGSEFREAARQMGWTEPERNNNEEESTEKPRIELPPSGILTLDGFLSIYSTELQNGKFWGIAYDLAVLGEALPDAGVFGARFDRLYCTSVLSATAVLDFTSERGCPNDVEPSDHLPVAATFTLAG